MIESERIAWVDIYKGLAILLVVIGHATGLFNGYIYQFHVAAFFFISGWVSKLDKIDLLEDCYKKFMTLVLPLLTMVIVFGMMTDVMMWFGVDKFFWNDGSILGLKNGVLSFIRNGSIIDLLGASWFVNVLFYVSILSHFLYVLSFRRHYIFAVLTLLVYVCGYFAMKNGFIMSYGMDLALVAQGYYGFGFLIKSYAQKINFDRTKRKNILVFVIFVVSTIFMWWMQQYLYGAALMDIANRHMNSFVWTLAAVVNGVLWLYALSEVIDILSLERIKNALIILGKNTLGIVFFHFAFFRITALLLVLFGGRINMNELKNLVPSVEIGGLFWPVYVVIAIIGSMVLWYVLKKLPIIKYGVAANNNIVNFIWTSNFGVRIRKLYIKVSNFIETRIHCGINFSSTYLFFRRITNVVTGGNGIFFLAIILSLFIFTSFLFNQGLVINDELFRMYLRKISFHDLFKFSFDMELYQGRAARIFVPILHTLTFVSKNFYLSRAIQIIMLLITSVLYGKILYVVFNNKWFAYLGVFLSIGLLPITYELSVPNAFVFHCTVSVCLYLISVYYFDRSLKTSSRFLLVVSCVFFFFSASCFEFMVTFAPLFFFHLIYVKQRVTIPLFLRYVLPVWGIGILYILFYFVAQRFFPSQYCGNSVVFTSIWTIVGTIFNVVKSAIPGYCLFNSKTVWICKDLSYFFTPTMSNFSEYFTWFCANVISVKILVVFFASCIIVCRVISKSSTKIGKEWPILGILILQLFLLPIPNSLTQMYQGRVNDSVFVGLPVSFPMHYLWVTIICIIVLYVVQRYKVRYIVCSLLVLGLTGVAVMNNIISDAQHRDYQRLCAIENLFNTNTIKLLNNKVVYAADIYATKMAMGFHDGYWTDFARLKKLNIIMDRNMRTDTNAYIFEVNKDTFVISAQKTYLLSFVSLRNKVLPIRINKDDVLLAKLDNEQVDNGLYLYPIE